MGPSKRAETKAPARYQTYPLYFASTPPYSAYIPFSSYPISVLSPPPERFLRVETFGLCQTKPIKGIARRDLRDPVADAAITARLQADVKERVEKLMITDLVRPRLVLRDQLGLDAAADVVIEAGINFLSATS